MKTLTTWGWFENATRTKQPIADNHHSGHYRYCARPQDTTGEHHLIKFGNNFDPGWVHPDRVTHRNWHFWDNPEFSHLLYPNPANTAGLKTWIRLVPHSIMTKHSDTPGEARVNEQLKRDSGGVLTTWRDIYAPRPVVSRGKHALIIASSPNCYRYYYNITRETWLDKIRTGLDKLGWTSEVRIKTGRGDRNGGNQLYRQLETGKYDLIVNQHSASTIESLLAGVPAVCDNLHCGGDLITTWQDFVAGADPVIPNTADVEEWMQVILGNCRHKTELKGKQW
jgi:hypothetical protein